MTMSAYTDPWRDFPYTYEDRGADHVPDFVIRLRDPASRGGDDLLTLPLEVSGEAKKEKLAKVAAAGACGPRRSTTGAVSAAGRSSRSPTWRTRPT